MGAFDNYTSPSAAAPAASGGAFSNYQPPAATHEPGAADWLPGSIWLNHMTRVLQNAATFGLADKLGDLPGTGTNVAAERAKTDTARAAVGPIASTAADIAGYAAGPGELGVASKIGGVLAPGLAKLPMTGTGRWLGGVLGSAAEGAGAGALGALGQGGDVDQAERAAKWGGGLGAFGGIFGGVTGSPGATPRVPIGPTPPLPPARSIADLEAAKTAAYAPLEAMVFHGPSQVKPALDAVANSMTDAEKDLAKTTMAKVNKLADTNLATGSDIQSYQKIFGGIGKTGSDMDREFAPKFKSALENVMQANPYGRNLTPGQGMSLMPGGSLGGTGFAAGDAAAARDAGDRVFGRLKDTLRVEGPEGWMAKAAAGGPDVGSQAKSWLPSEEGIRYAPGPPPGAPAGTQGSPLFGATQNLASTAKPEASAPWYLKHTVIAPMAFGAGNELVNAFGGEQSPGARVAEDVAAFPLLMGGMKGYSAAASAMNRATQRRAVELARIAASTGHYQPPFQPQIAAPLSDAMRKLIFGQAAAGQWPK